MDAHVKLFRSLGIGLSVSMRGYERSVVDEQAKLMAAAVERARAERVSTESKLGEVRTLLRRTEERVSSLERRVSDAADQIAENEQPTLSGSDRGSKRFCGFPKAKPKTNAPRPGVRPPRL